jgi:hypothetical protein
MSKTINQVDVKYIDALSRRRNYQEQVEDENGEMVDNPQTKESFFWEKVNEYIKNEYEADLRDTLDAQTRATLEALLNETPIVIQ